MPKGKETSETVHRAAQNSARRQEETFASWNAAMEEMDKETAEPRGMNILNEFLSNAEQFARFTNIEGQKEFDKFNQGNANFLPLNFWKDVKAGKIQVAFKDPTRAKSTFTIHSHLDLRDLARAAWEERFPIDRSILLLILAASSDGKLLFPPSPFQRSVIFLTAESWRARFCGTCGHRFVADKPARRFCSEECSRQGRNASHKAWWGKHGREWRRKTRHGAPRQHRSTNKKQH